MTLLGRANSAARGIASTAYGASVFAGGLNVVYELRSRDEVVSFLPISGLRGHKTWFRNDLAKRQRRREFANDYQTLAVGT